MSSFCLIYSNKSYSVLEFYKKRFLRIVPGYWTITIVNLLLLVLSNIIFSKNYFHTSTNVIDYIINLLLIHGVVPGAANNHVVLGGWYIGTSNILYLIFPLLYKLYFRIQSVHRYLYFPIVTFILCYILITCFEFILGIKCTNNSFLYFSFINQLPVFVLGFSLYDILNKEIVIKHLQLKAILFLILSCITFYHPSLNSYTITPFIFTLSIMYLFLICHNSHSIYENRLLRLLTKFLDISFSIYLTHTYVIYNLFGMIIIKLLRNIGFYQYPTLAYVVLLPIIYIIVYIVGDIFNAYLNKINNRLIAINC